MSHATLQRTWHPNRSPRCVLHSWATAPYHPIIPRLCVSCAVSCANWAKNGECEKDHVRKLCPHSCSICSHICRDSDAQCPQWKASGECEANMDFMYNSCSVSCGVCKVTCYDKDASCPAWARDGECQKNKGLYTTCPVSCGTCTEICLDKNNDCPSWAADGQCGTNAGFMLKTCPHSCSVCDEKSHAASAHPVSDVNMVTKDGRKITERAACADHDRNQCLICARPRPPPSLPPCTPTLFPPSLFSHPPFSYVQGASTSVRRIRRR